jgi:hypothetical protein
VVNGKREAIDVNGCGTKAAAHYRLTGRLPSVENQLCALPC